MDSREKKCFGYMPWHIIYQSEAANQMYTGKMNGLCYRIEKEQNEI